MKKILTFLLVGLLTFSFVYAQDAAVEENVTVEKSSKIKLPNRLGAFFNYQPAVGAFGEYVKCNVGGGITYELGIPLPMACDLGVVAHGVFNYNPVKSDAVSSVWNMQYYAGAYLNVPFGSSGFAFHPELCYGLVCYYPTIGKDYVGNLNKTYLDQVIMLSAGLRFSNPKFANGNIELELAPTYTLTPEKQSCINFIGGRAGFVVTLNGDKKTPEEKAAIAVAKAEKQAAAAELKAAKEAEKAAAAEAKQKEKEEAAAAAAELKAAKEAEKAAAAEAKQKAKEEAAAAKAAAEESAE